MHLTCGLSSDSDLCPLHGSDAARANAAGGLVKVGTGALAADDVVAIARGHAQVQICPEAETAMARGRAVIDRLAADTVGHYGVSTGFGALASTRVSEDQRDLLQASLVRSHAAGSGGVMPCEVVRAMVASRLATMCTGHTGVRPVLAHTYAAMLNAHITPVVREYGSLGCSGDLAPLSHTALAAMGEGEVFGPDGQIIPAAEALAAAGITPITLAAKEGLALINGTNGMLGMLVLALHDLEMLMTVADVAAAMSVEALLGTDKVFAPDIQALRPHRGQAVSAANIAAFLADSPIIASHQPPQECDRVQDAYSLRCTPQVHGAARDTMTHAAMVAGHELSAVIDNPVVTPSEVLKSNGNFHGAPVGYVLDFLAIAVADVASISERRTDRCLDPARSLGLPPFLAHSPGVDSGLMIAQYTAAGICSELKRLAVPASVDSIPSSAMQEDHVSMGWAAGCKLRRAVVGLRQVLAIELLTAARALELRAPLTPGPVTGAVVSALRASGVAGPGPDAPVSPDIDAAVACIASGDLLRALPKLGN